MILDTRLDGHLETRDRRRHAGKNQLTLGIANFVVDSFLQRSFGRAEAFFFNTETIRKHEIDPISTGDGHGGHVRGKVVNWSEVELEVGAVIDGTGRSLDE